MEEFATKLDERYSFSKNGKLSSGILKNVMRDWVCINDNETDTLIWVRKSDIKNLKKIEAK
ncbi:MAG: hypothetical protein H0W84_02625 [Bacteroidetes bacterium]|nr:hypothetical protein [Bacteroidota bacterium]